VIPLHQEQLFLARNLERRGAAVIGYQDQEHFANLLGALSKDYRYRQNAVALAQECDQNHTRDACAHIERRFQLLTETSI
jgi:hypothetical protein